MIFGIDTGREIGIAALTYRKEIFTTKKVLIEPEECLTIFEDFYKSLGTNKTSMTVFIEDYKIYNYPKSIISALKGDLKYVIKTGILLQHFCSSCKIKAFMISPTWKGTMSDKIVKCRVLEKIEKYKLTLNNIRISSHEYDAIGIILSKLGLFNE